MKGMAQNKTTTKKVAATAKKSTVASTVETTSDSNYNKGQEPPQENDSARDASGDNISQRGGRDCKGDGNGLYKDNDSCEYDGSTASNPRASTLSSKCSLSWSSQRSVPNVLS